MRLQAKLDARLARKGFVDIEGGADTNLISGSTFRRAADTDHGPAVILGLGHEADLTSDEGERGGRDTVFNAPRARAWALFSQAAHDMPTDRRTRRILVAFAETGSSTETARRLGSTRPTVDRWVDRLCAALGLNRRWLCGTLFESTPGSVERQLPAPARRLSRREIERLRYEPPSAERKAS